MGFAGLPFVVRWMAKKIQMDVDDLPFNTD
jgi:hypothetical protein